MTESIMFGDGYRGLLFAALVPAMVIPILTQAAAHVEGVSHETPRLGKAEGGRRKAEGRSELLPPSAFRLPLSTRILSFFGLRHS